MAERIGSYLVRKDSIVIMDEIARAANSSTENISEAGLAPMLL